MTILAFFLLHWYLSLFAQTFYLHRYGAHQMFTMNKFWERFFYLLTIIFQGSSFLSPRSYAVMHRLHHAHADTENDPHSPKYSDNLFHMMWKTKNIYTDILDNKVIVDSKFTKNLPEWPLAEKIAGSWPVRVLWGILYILFYVKFATAWWMFLLLPVHFLMGPVHGAIINWFAHKYGYVSYPVNDTAKNMLPVDVLMMGESYHNNHHKFGGRANFGKRWHELDPTYIFIVLFDKVGIIRLKKNNDNNYM